MGLLTAVKQSKLLRSAAVYTISSAINAGIPFLLLPILTRYLTPTEYGLVAMFRVLVIFLMPFMGLNVYGAISRQYVERHEIDYGQYVGNSILILFSSSVIISTFIFILIEPFSQYSGISREWIMAIPLVAMARVLILCLLVVWQMESKPLSYGVFQIIQTAANVGLSLFLVIRLSQGWVGRVQGELIATVMLATMALAILHVKRLLNFKINRAYIVNALKFGVPLVPHTLGASIILMADKFFITNMVSVADTGIYEVGYQIGTIVSLLQTAFNQAWVPWLYERLKRDDASEKRQVVKYTYIYFVVVILLSLVLTIVAPLFLSFYVGDQYSGAAAYVFWIALGYAFNGMYKIVSTYIFYEEKNYILAQITVFAAIINLVANFLLIRIYGAIGAAQATCIAFIISFALTWLLANRVYPMPWRLTKTEVKLKTH